MAVKSSQQKMREIEYAAIALISGEGINAIPSDPSRISSLRSRNYFLALWTIS